MITKELILELHGLSITRYGGSHGLRDEGLLESAIARPYQTFSGEDLYIDIYQKAAAIAESLILNHPFVDGNKRIGLLSIIAILHFENIEISATQEHTYDFIISISTGKIRFEQITDWIRSNTSLLKK